MSDIQQPDPMEYPHAELRPAAHECVIRGVYSSVYVGAEVTGVNFTNVVVLGSVIILGTNTTGRIYAYTGSEIIRGGNNALTITECDPEELHARARSLNSQQ